MWVSQVSGQSPTGPPPGARPRRQPALGRGRAPGRPGDLRRWVDVLVVALPPRPGERRRGLAVLLALAPRGAALLDAREAPEDRVHELLRLLALVVASLVAGRHRGRVLSAPPPLLDDSRRCPPLSLSPSTRRSGPRLRQRQKRLVQGVRVRYPLELDVRDARLAMCSEQGRQ